MKKELSAVSTFALEAEKIHAQLFSDAQKAAKEGKDMQLEAVYICPVCGHTVLGQCSGQMPCLRRKKEMYKKF